MTDNDTEREHFGYEPTTTPEEETTVFFEETEDDQTECPACGSRDTYGVDSHSDTVCRDCGWILSSGQCHRHGCIKDATETWGRDEKPVCDFHYALMKRGVYR